MAVPRSSFCSFRVILVIGDVYKRNEIRHLASLLLDRLKFLRVFIHQASVCATYRIGLPTACVINIGDHKTSICCIEDGIAHSETRVNLPIGRTDVIRLFHALLLPEGLEHEHLDLSYKRLSDVDDLREALEHANQLVMDVLRDTTHDDVSKWKTDGIEPINFPFTWTHGKLNCPNISFPISSVILSNIMPFAIMSTMWENDNSLKCMLQSSAQSSEPDDPFDDLYVTLTAREKRKRGPGQSGLQNEQNTTDTTNNYNQQQQRDIELETIDPAIHNHISTSQIKPKWFNSLAEAVWWSITQCGNLISTQVNSDTPQSNIYLPGASEEVCRRLLSSILFTGGGASGAACQLLEKWLAERISQITKEKLSSTIVGVHAPPVEIISENDSADLAWTGAKLIITTDLLGDLWITQNEWQQHGSRVLREKVPFLW